MFFFSKFKEYRDALDPQNDISEAELSDRDVASNRDDDIDTSSGKKMHFKRSN